MPRRRDVLTALCALGSARATMAQNARITRYARWNASRPTPATELPGWDGGAGATRTVDSHVKALRTKIGAERVRTVHGVGYALEDR